jgi:indolepyruvate ferredoxin oxidoreductase beta subunit
VALEPVEGLRILDFYGNPKVMTLLNTRTIHPIDVISGDATYPEVSKVISKIKELSRRVWTLNATEIALEMGDPIFSNIVMLGALCAMDVLPINREGFESVIKDLLPSRRIDENMKAFNRGKEMVQEI